MSPAIHAWAMEGNDMFEADAAKHIAAGEDPTSARAAVKAEAEWHLAKGLDEMREQDPDKAAEMVMFIRRMCAELGRPVPYPFN